MKILIDTREQQPYRFENPSEVGRVTESLLCRYASEVEKKFNLMMGK